MTDNDKQPQGGALAGNTVIVAALMMAIGAFVYREAPLLPSRPTSTEAALRDGSRVYSPLWQDPFVAVAQASRSRGEGGTRNSASSSRFCERLTDLPARANDPLLRTAIGDTPVADRSNEAIRLAVTVTGGPNYEDLEYRRRLRYAVLAGLDRAGFRPADPRQLHYCFHEPSWSGPIPFEWLVAKGPSEKASMTAADRSRRDKVMLLWVNEDALGDRPLSRLDELRKTVTISEPLYVLGPQSSDTLVKMTKQGPVSRGLRIFSYGVTAEKPCALPIEDCLDKNNVEFSRAIASDELLADAIVDELDKRGVVPGERQHVALVAETDSFYGRTLLETMARRLEKPASEKNACCGRESSVHRLGYYHGLDGAVAKPDNSGERS